MIIYTDENLFLSPAQTLVNTVNTVGIMGKGIAKDFKHYYPEMFEHYKKLCQNQEFDVGQLLLRKEERVICRGKPTDQFRKRWVLNFPTKRHWRAKSKLEYIDAGLNKFVHEYARRGIKSVSFPQLGVGNGGLDWQDVQKLMKEYLGKLDIPVYIHIYHSHTDHYNQVNKKMIEQNLNTAHDDWKNGQYIKQAGLDVANSFVNVDGIIVPENDVYDQVKKLANIKHFSLLKKKDDAVWLQKETQVNERHVEQLSLGI